MDRRSLSDSWHHDATLVHSPCCVVCGGPGHLRAMVHSQKPLCQKSEQAQDGSISQDATRGQKETVSGGCPRIFRKIPEIFPVEIRLNNCWIAVSELPNAKTADGQTFIGLI